MFSNVYWQLKPTKSINHIPIPTTQNIKDLGPHYNNKIELSVHVKQKSIPKAI